MYRVVRAVNTFCVTDLSSLYLDALKDTLYTERADAPRRRSAQTVLYDILVLLLKVTAPILAFTVDEAWEHLTVREEDAPSVHLTRWPAPVVVADGPQLAARWDRLVALRTDILKALEAARAAGTIGSALEARVIITAASTDECSQLTADREALTILAIVSAVDVVAGTAGRTIQVQRAAGRKCARCWMFRTSVGRHSAHPELCDRCMQVITEAST